jgi:hypothetical protein
MSNTNWSFKFRKAGVVLDADPNITPPSDNVCVTISNRFDDQTIGLCLLTKGAAATSYTVTVYVYDANTAGWLVWADALVVTMGTVQVLSVPPTAKLFIRVTAVGGAPTDLFAGEMPYLGTSRLLFARFRFGGFPWQAVTRSSLARSPPLARP